MISLVDRSPCQDLLPVEVEGARLAEYVPDAISWVAPFRGQDAQVSDELLAQVGCAFPEPNRFTESGSVRALSFSAGEALVIGAHVEVDGAATADLSDGWAILHLTGEMARDVLARLTPVDLRPHVFQKGHTARTLVGHMTASVSRIDDEVWEILVFRSMAKTAVHDLTRAMKAVAARKSL